MGVHTDNAGVDASGNGVVISSAGVDAGVYRGSGKVEMCSAWVECGNTGVESGSVEVGVSSLRDWEAPEQGLTEQG